jgi:hypothetical protein
LTEIDDLQVQRQRATFRALRDYPGDDYGEGDDVVRTNMRLGRVALALCTVAAVLWLAPVATAEAAISGTVTDTTAHPLEGIEVCAVTTGPFGSETCTQTDGSGKYAIASAGSGSLVHFYSRANQAPGYAPQWYPGKPFFEEAEGVAPADVANVDAVMSPGGTVTGTVLSTQGSTPIEGVEVCPDPVVFREREVTWCDKTDASGKFALRGLSIAEYRFEFNTEGNVNYVEKLTPPLSVTAGGLILEAHLVPGVEVDGTLTEAGTGLPIEGLTYPPYSVPLICALDAGTEERIKCTAVGIGGDYKLPGLPPGELFGVSFAVDGVEEGLDLWNDGYVRQYWHGVPAWNEATMMFGSGGVTLPGVDAVLSRGDEVFPHCEVVSACPPPAQSGPLPSPTGTQTPTTTLPPLTQPAVHCKKGYTKVERIAYTRCFKVQKKKHHKRRHHKHAHRHR